MWAIDGEGAGGVLEVRVLETLGDADLLWMKLAIRQGLAIARARRGRGLLLFDMLRSEETPARSIERFHSVDGALLNRPDDRVAIVVPSVAAKAEARRRLRWPAQTSLFLSTAAARSWLTAALDREPDPLGAGG